MSIPVVVGAGAFQAAQDSISVPWPAGHVVDDLGLLVVTQHSGNISGVGLPGIAGFVKLFELNMDGGGQFTRSGIYWKIATSNSESNVSIFSGSSRPLRGQIVVIRNATTPQLSWGTIASYGNISGTGTPITNNINGLGFNQNGRWLAFDMLAHRLNVNGPRLNELILNTLAAQDYTLVSDNSAILTGGFILAKAEALNSRPSFGIKFNTPGGTSYFSRALLMIPAALSTSSFSSSGTSSVSNPGNVNRQSAFSASGLATVSNPGALKVASAFASAGLTTVSNPGNALARSSFNAAGTSTAIMVGAGSNASSFSSINSSSANMVGVSVAESSFSSQGSSLAAMFSPSMTSSSFSASGLGTARMYSPSIQVTTLVDGSGGQANGEAEIDWTLCDFANIELTEGNGSYSIEHINLIAGKRITVHVLNNGATGSLLWNNGDAPVNWKLAGPPAIPANGETLHVAFECNEDRTEILGWRIFDDEVREVLAGLDQRYGRTLFDHSTDAANVGSGETTLYSDIIVGGTLANDNDKILAEYAVKLATSLNAKQIRIYFPTTVIVFDTGSLAITAATDCDLKVLITRKSPSTARAVVTIGTLPVSVGGGNAQITDETTLTGLDFNADNVLKITGTGGASDDVIAKLGYGEFKPAAV